MSFGVRGTGGGESVCKGTGQTHFVREPVCSEAAHALSRSGGRYTSCCATSLLLSPLPTLNKVFVLKRAGSSWHCVGILHIGAAEGG